MDIEVWLKNVEEEMRVTLKRKMRNGKSDYELKDRKDWVLCHPGQVVATISQYYWTN
jgi:dynein heavy chain